MLSTELAEERKWWYFQGSINSYLFPPLAAIALMQHMNTVAIQKYCVGKSCGNRYPVILVTMLGNYKPKSVRGKLHNLHAKTLRPFMPYTDRKCQSQIPA